MSTTTLTALSTLPAATAVWQLRLLGGFSLDDGQQQLTRLRSRAATVLLMRLALAPERSHSREELADLLWPEAAPDAARNRLRQTLFGLKAVLEPPGGPLVLQADRRVVRLAHGAVWCDVPAFEQALRARRLEEARALYRGELLPGLYDDWVHEERQRLQALADRLGEAPGRAGAPASCTPAPFAAEQHALEHYALQTHAAARHAPEKPGAARPAAADAGAAPANPPRPLARSVRLPQYLTRLVGADLSGARLRDLVTQHRLVTVLGAGGCGKTRLAVEVARFVSQAGAGTPGERPPFERAIFVSLVGCVSATSLLDGLLLALQIGSAGDPFEKLLAALDDQPLLVLLDNAEQLDDAAVACAARLAEQLPQVHWLVTSRRPLGLDGEHRFALEPLESPAAAAPLAEVALNPAVALFVDRARAHRLEFHVTAANRESVVGLVGWLGGLPLAIELAASRSSSLAPAQMLALLQNDRRDPQAGAAALAWLSRRGPRSGQDERQASMLAVIGWSWELLSPALQRMLLAVSALPAGASLAAAAALSESVSLAAAAALSESVSLAERRHGAVPAAPLPLLTAQTQLDELAAHSMLQARSGHLGDARYFVNQPIREFALSRQGPEQARAQRAALRAWALQWARALPATPPLPEVREELPNLLAALVAALADGCGDEALTLILSLQSSWGEIALPTSALDALDQLLALPGLDASLAAGGHALAAWSAYEGGRREAARAHADAALALPIDDEAQRAMVLHRVARIRWRVGRDAAGARELLAQALPLAQKHALHGTHGALLSLEAHLAATTDRQPERAEALNHQALALCRLTGNAHLVNAHRFNLAVANILRRRHAEALAELQALAAEGRTLHDWDLVAGALDASGTALLALRRWPEAAQAHRDSLAVAWDAMDPLATIFALWNIAPALARIRQPQLAAQTMAFAEHCWPKHFGELDANDLRDVKRVRRFVGRLLPAAAAEAAWQQGRHMPLADAVRALLKK